LRDQDFNKTAVDSSNGANGAAMAATTSPAFAGATAVGFNGRGANISIPNSTVINAVSSGTTVQRYAVELWFNTSFLDGSSSTFQSLYSKGNSFAGAARGFGAQLRGDGCIWAYVGGATSGVCSPVSQIVAGRWYHAVIQYNGTQFQIMLNGVVVLDWTAVTSGAQEITSPLWIGSTGNPNPLASTTSINFRGAISEFAFYNFYNFTAGRAQEHYNASLQARNLPISAIGGNNQVTLSWNAPTTTGGSPVIGYRIVRSNTSTSQPGIEPLGSLVSPVTLDFKYRFHGHNLC
jgi:hypothetical protein